MNWVDLVALVIIVGIAFLESRRGFGLALFDLIGAIIASKLAISFYEAAGKALPFNLKAQDAQGFWIILMFLILGALVLLASRFLYSTTLLSLDVMDPVVGAILGIASGIITAHIILRGMVLAAAGTPFETELAGTFAVIQLVDQTGFKALMEVLTHIGELPPE